MSNLWTPSIEVESVNGTREVSLTTRHLMNRNVFLQGTIDSDMANQFLSQLLYLEQESEEPVTIYINSPGGEVNAGLVIYDAIQGSNLEINMICTGMAASMAAILLAGGQKGNRYILEHSKVMIHEPLLANGVGGSATSIKNISESILITVNSRLGAFDTPELNTMTAKDDIRIAALGQKKTALFVVVSDTDRSLDGLANIFFTQAMNELCRYADKHCKDNCLPVPVRFILDDFATNCKIDEFPRMISSIRSRGISTMLMIQAESQLTEQYGYDGKTIIGNCDTYVYLGSNDVDTAKAVAERCDVSVKKVLNMPVGTNWIFRRGQAPVHGRNFVLEPFLSEKNLIKREKVEELEKI